MSSRKKPASPAPVLRREGIALVVQATRATPLTEEDLRAIEPLLLSNPDARRLLVEVYRLRHVLAELLAPAEKASDATVAASRAVSDLWLAVQKANL